MDWWVFGELQMNGWLVGEKEWKVRVNWMDG